MTLLLDKNSTQGTFLVCQAAVRAILEAGLTEGAIVNISSQAVQRLHRGLCGYITAKGGIEALTRSMALELAEHGIRCNCVAPGFTDTPKAAETLSEEFRRSLVKLSRLGRIARPEEIANVVAFLCSPRKFLRGRNSNECRLTYRPREFGIDHARKSNVKHMNRKKLRKTS
ncbi:hypothetical protein HPB48_008581 [Haemaphysalis longicornis]|uniref:Uncharacterized protein n=1 Tax=Haemaphysalis longicornis TaxID=44386 RepID=A0A9J6GXG9_HAELO|nr:hypothetical protein HPB48_008581 [Haemaphysalis longicornis]